MGDCVFCDIVNGDAPATIVDDWDDAIAFVPLGPVAPGHVLVVPRQHVADAAEAPAVTGAVTARAASYASRLGCDFNLITSTGATATQSIFHLHLHVVPRAADDQLMVPWGTLHGENPQDPHRCKGMVALEDVLRRCREGDGLALPWTGQQTS